MNKDTKQFIGISIFLILFAGFVFGAFELISARSHNEAGCKYESLYGFIPSRVIVCELGRKRWDIPKDNTFKK